MAGQQQPFSSVCVNVTDIKGDEELQMTIELEMTEYERARINETIAANNVVLASAALLTARGARATTRIRLINSFAKGSEKVAMEPNWEPFRNSDGRPAVENFMSERDQRNIQRMGRLQMNHQTKEMNVNVDGMFENPGQGA